MSKEMRMDSVRILPGFVDGCCMDLGGFMDLFKDLYGSVRVYVLSRDGVGVDLVWIWY